jgi:AraC-like DNA-binding protein
MRKKNSSKSSITNADKIPIDKVNLLQYIDYLQSIFPGLTLSKISDLANLSRLRLSSILYDSRYKYLHKVEIKRLFQVYEGLKNGEMTYKPRKCRRAKERVKQTFTRKPIFLNRDNLRQYIDFLRAKFPGLSVEQISRMAGLHRDYLKNILCNNQKSIDRTTAESIMRVYEELESGNVAYVPIKIIFVNILIFYKQNFLAYQ